MNQCDWLSDRMPTVVLGRAEWTRDEIQHLNGCPSCQQEWELVQTTSRLGEGLKRLDASASSEALLQRLNRSTRERRQRTWSIAVLAAAAVIAVLLWSNSREIVRESPPAQVVAGLEIPLPELEGLQPAELDSVLKRMDEPAAEGSALEEPDLGDLDSEELETVLDYWEG